VVGGARVREWSWRARMGWVGAGWEGLGVSRPRFLRVVQATAPAVVLRGVGGVPIAVGCAAVQLGERSCADPSCFFFSR